MTQKKPDEKMTVALVPPIPSSSKFRKELEEEYVLPEFDFEGLEEARDEDFRAERTFHYGKMQGYKDALRALDKVDGRDRAIAVVKTMAEKEKYSKFSYYSTEDFKASFLDINYKNYR